MILNIETSSKICSVALYDSGDILYNLESEKDMEHSTKLAPFVEQCFEELQKRNLYLDAVAVSIGPGSYTGLRIGLSLAKGICFSKKIPLIGIPTLELLAVKAIFSMKDFKDDRIFIPLIDARRMEVYTAAYNNNLQLLLDPQPLILDNQSFIQYENKSVIMIGDGVIKAKDVLQVNVEKWIDAMPVARDMGALSEKYYRENRFLDLAYSTPLYLKNFQATTPKNRF